MSHFILVFASFFVMFLMCAGVMILRAPLMDFPDADEDGPLEVGYIKNELCK